jgi:hypothetical protein
MSVSLIILFLSCLLTSGALSQQTNIGLKNCLIHNKEYQYEYLTRVFYPGNSANLFQDVYSVRLADSVNFEWMLWSLEPTDEYLFEAALGERPELTVNKTFYLRSGPTDQYLCAKNRFGDVFNARRVISTIKIGPKRVHKFDSCKWMLKKAPMLRSDKGKVSFSIWNAHYLEPLYASVFVAKQPLFKKVVRSVYLWRNKEFKKSELKFNWFIDCGRGDFVWI